MVKGEEPFTRKSMDYGIQTSGRTKRLSDGVGKLTKRNVGDNPQSHPNQNLPKRR